MKWFKDKEKFIKLAKDFKVHWSTIIFKIDIFKLTDKHPKLMKSSARLGFLKTTTKILRYFVTKIQTSSNKPSIHNVTKKIQTQSKGYLE